MDSEESWGANTVLVFNVGDGCLSFFFSLEKPFSVLLIFLCYMPSLFKKAKRKTTKWNHGDDSALLSLALSRPLKMFILYSSTMTNLNSILKSRDITLLTKVHIVQAMVSPVDMYGCESWAIKKAEHWRVDAFQLVLEKTLESPLDYSEIKSINPQGNQPWIFIERTDAELKL